MDADKKELEKKEIETKILLALDKDGKIDDSEVFAAEAGVNHAMLPGAVRSLSSHGMLTYEEFPRSRVVLTEDGQRYLVEGSPEFQVFSAVSSEGTSMDDLKAKLGAIADVGFRQAMQNKWLALVKGDTPLIQRKIDSLTEDRVQLLLQDVKNGKELSPADLDYVTKKRKMVAVVSLMVYKLAKGPQFALEKKKAATDLTADLLANGAWKNLTFKDYNFQAMGQPTSGGQLHPLLKVRARFREIFFEMGFEEMPTNNFVESSFWNFDSLFQPQQHPARDSHDTFFLLNPVSASNFPPEYLARVKATHEVGGYGSRGYGYDWKLAEAEKNLLRTHTTAVSSRMLYKLAQEGFQPKKYFSIDRVFRNEAVDRTHLAEFHQVEGLICDRGLTLGDLIGTLNTFFARMGMSKLRFKPAYNPYTEPSMEIFSYHEQLKKWVEVGNSGMFRPEMLRPMGLPEDVNVIAWGLSLERPTMIMYHIDNIRDLFGHRVNLGIIKSNPICRLGLGTA
eukprot:jgi/Mesvir1/18728/Mv01241-RA.1